MNGDWMKFDHQPWGAQQTIYLQLARGESSEIPGWIGGFNRRENHWTIHVWLQEGLLPPRSLLHHESTNSGFHLTVFWWAVAAKAWFLLIGDCSKPNLQNQNRGIQMTFSSELPEHPTRLFMATLAELGSFWGDHLPGPWARWKCSGHPSAAEHQLPGHGCPSGVHANPKNDRNMQNPTRRVK